MYVQLNSMTKRVQKYRMTSVHFMYIMYCKNSLDILNWSIYVNNCPMGTESVIYIIYFTNVGKNMTRRYVLQKYVVRINMKYFICIVILNVYHG